MNHHIHHNYLNALKKGIFLFLLFSLFILGRSSAQTAFSTDYFAIKINNKGFITSMKNITVKPNREFSPADKPSPLMSLISKLELEKYAFTQKNHIRSERDKSIVLASIFGTFIEHKN